jgi:type 1 glutamine amidotransferase
MYMAGPPASAAPEEAGFKPIFNGRNLDGWEGDKQFWSVKKGAIRGQSTKEIPAKRNTFLIWRAGELDDFELRLSYRVVWGNSGIQYRSSERENWIVAGYQADIESGDRWTGILYDEHGRGVLAERGQKTVIDTNGNKKVTKFGEPDKLMETVKKENWNDYTIIAKGNHLVHKINGRVMCEVIDNQASQSERSGILALQVHSGPPMTVEFKNIRLKRLPLEDKKKIVLVAGRRSHGNGTHEHNAGVLLLKHCLDKHDATLNVAYLNGWPKDPTAFDNADSIMMFLDGGGGHPITRGDRLEQMDALMKRGTGLAMIHYAVEVTKNKFGDTMREWIGGCYEGGYSTNPCWHAKFTAIPGHPVARGLKPFDLFDEWYFNMRFIPDMKGVVPLLKAVPPEKARRTKAAKEFPGRAEIVAWCMQRPDGGRGFGFTGGHFHKNWGNEYFRKIVLNALLWTAHAEVPENGVQSEVSAELLKKNLD